MRLHPSFAAIAVPVLLAAAHCGGSVTPSASCTSGCGPDGGSSPDSSPPDPPCKPPVPLQHRPASVACSTTRPPGYSDPSGPSPDAGYPGTCNSDSQCTMGTNPRCTPSGHNGLPTCASDACATDTQCGSSAVCECGTTLFAGRSPNTCLPGGCQTDADCGPGGYCSPTFDTMCGSFDGIVGYHCHRPADQCSKDECTNDSECAEGGYGFCAWEPTVGKWTCSHAACAG